MKNINLQPTFYFHDYESFGINPALDRPSQFAGVRTDYDLNIIDDPLVIYCQPATDYLPNPEAVLITGITPQEALQKGICEAEFTKQIHLAFSESNTCILGYNNIRFDDEITRNILYRNFYDPYEYSFKNGNSRWDLLDVVRACYALRPDGINWPTNNEGLPSFRLEHLTQANNIAHEHAHDAMSDVYATIAMAKLIKQKQPKLFDYFFSMRAKHKVQELIDIVKMTPITHVSGMLGAYRGNTTLVCPIIWHPIQRNSAVVCDLAGDVDLLINLSTDEIKQRLYTKNEDLDENESRIPVKLIHTNKCPIVSPAKSLLPQNANRLQIDLEKCQENLIKLRHHQKDLQQKMLDLFSQQNDYPINSDVDTQLYGAFLNQHDKLLCNTIRNSLPDILDSLSVQFSDPRLSTLFFRYKARNYPQSLTQSEKVRWQDHCQEKLNTHLVQDYLLTLEQFTEQYEQQPQKLDLLKSLYNYCHYLLR